MTDGNLPITSLDLKTYFSQEEFVVKTCQQINKDMVGLIQNPLEFNVDLEQDVLEQLVRIVAQNLKKMSDLHLRQFIYKVDMKEQEFESNLNRQLGIEDLAFKVIRREAQKIFLRIKFSQQ